MTGYDVLIETATAKTVWDRYKTSDLRVDILSSAGGFYLIQITWKDTHDGSLYKVCDISSKSFVNYFDYDEAIKAFMSEISGVSHESD